MDTEHRPGHELLEVARALLLLQGAILVATTIEALFWGFVFPGGGASALTSGIATVVVFLARARLRTDRRWPRRLVYLVEGLTVALMAVDVGLAIALTRALPPVVALLTQLALPIAVITLLRRSARAAAVPSAPLPTLEPAS